jgi:hypothetical protein
VYLMIVEMNEVKPNGQRASVVLWTGEVYKRDTSVIEEWKSSSMALAKAFDGMLCHLQDLLARIQSGPLDSGESGRYGHPEILYSQGDMDIMHKMYGEES